MFDTTSWLELSQSALERNISFIRKQIGENVRYSSVVKGNAYGHGIEKFVRMAEKAGVDHFSVFSGDEAFRVKKAASGNPEIMVMGWLDKDEMRWAISEKIAFWIFEPESLTTAIALADEMNTRARIHIELETGMNRTGLTSGELTRVIEMIKLHPGNLTVEGVCTHYAGAESVANFVRVNRQISRFNKLYKKITASGIKPKLRHTACSAAAMNYPKTRMEMVRIGIMQYGFWPSIETYIQFLHGQEYRYDPLDRIISWKSKVMSIKSVSEGEFISYGNTYLAQEEKLIAIIPVGYSHGFSRDLSNQGRVLINGNRVGVIGMVNMNMMIADVSSMPNARIGDEVVIIGKQDSLEITVASFSEISNQVNYELLVRLPESTRRTIVN
ncbi:MAG TPA: alanine racemase [Bacteroidales bacterium]|nr:alanine racemase [Bacteroidales bacterium]